MYSINVKLMFDFKHEISKLKLFRNYSKRFTLYTIYLNRIVSVLMTVLTQLLGIVTPSSLLPIIGIINLKKALQ